MIKQKSCSLITIIYYNPRVTMVGRGVTVCNGHCNVVTTETHCNNYRNNDCNLVVHSERDRNSARQCGQGENRAQNMPRGSEGQSTAERARSAAVQSVRGVRGRSCTVGCNGMRLRLGTRLWLSAAWLDEKRLRGPRTLDRALTIIDGRGPKTITVAAMLRGEAAR